MVKVKGLKYRCETKSGAANIFELKVNAFKKPTLII